MKEVSLITIDDKQTRFMQAADVFEPWKVLIGQVLTLKVNPCVDITNEWLENLAKTFEANGQGVLMVSFEDKAWRNPNVRAVSNGKTWTRF